MLEVKTFQKYIVETELLLRKNDEKIKNFETQLTQLRKNLDQNPEELTELENKSL